MAAKSKKRAASKQWQKPPAPTKPTFHLGLVFGLFLGALLGAETVFRNYIPFPTADSLATILFAVVLLAVPYGILGLLLPIIPRFRTSGPQLSFFLSFSVLLFAGFLVNAKMSSGASQPKSIIVDIVLIGAAVLLYFLVDESMPKRLRRAWLLLPAAAVAISLLACLHRTPPLPRPSGETVPPAGPRKVLLFGIEGAEWRIIDPLLRDGKLPNFKRLIDDGVAGYLETIVPANSPLIWTTMVTGKEPARHGVNHFIVRDVPFLPLKSTVFPYWSGLDHFCRLFPKRPISSTERRTNALWDILNHTDVPCGFLHWWASYPVAPVEPFQVASTFLFDFGLWKKHGWDYLEEEGADLYPEGIRRDLIERFRSPETIGASDLRRFLGPAPSTDDELADALSLFQGLPGWQKPVFGVSRPVESEAFRLGGFLLPYLDDCSRHTQALYLYERYHPEFFGVYLRGIGDVEHFFWHYMEPDSFAGYEIDPESVARYADVIPNYYVFTDSLLGSFMDAMEDSTILCVVSDHGHRPSGRLPWSGSHTFDPAPPGVILLWGEGIEKKEFLSRVTVYDIMPTLLDFLGLPAAEDMPGKVLSEVYSGRERGTPPRIPSYDHRFRGWEEILSARESRGDATEAELERLRALGYIN